MAGFFYEFIFSPTRGSSLCYRPKLFRLSAHDMAKIGSKSRLNQQRQAAHPCQGAQQNCSLIIPTTIRPSTTTIHGPQLLNSNHNNQTFHHSPNSSSRPQAFHSSMMSNTSLLKPTRDSQLINSATTSAASHSQSSYPICSNLDQLFLLQRQQQLQDIEAASNLDRSKSAAIVAHSANMMQHQTNGLNLPSNRNNGDLGKFATQARFMDQIEFR